jgi:inorganic triphosphatase YgiF
MSHEIELKLELVPDSADRLMEQSWFADADCRSTQQLSVYYDTPEGMLREKGYTLRVRTAVDRYIQTVKSLGGGAGLFDRGEWESGISGPEPDLAELAGTPLGELSLGDLGPIIRSEVSRTSCRMHANGADIELDLDRGQMSAGENAANVCELEIELLRGKPRAVVELARLIADRVPVKLGVLSKAERGFALANGTLGKVAKAEPVPVRADMSVAEAFATIVSACVGHFRLNEQIVIDRRQVEALHQARVAMRRLRSALSLFRPAIADHEFEHIREELRWFTGQLGDARNLDVYLQRDIADEERGPLERKREEAYDTVVAAMDSARFRRLVLDLIAWAALGQWRGHAAAEKPLEPVINHRIDRIWHRIKGAGDLADMDDEMRHRVRIQAKKLRYALEFVETLHLHGREQQKKFGKAIEDLQEALGHLNDAAIARTLTTADAWPILPSEPGEEEKAALKEAETALNRLRKIGAYWRRHDDQA